MRVHLFVSMVAAAGVMASAIACKQSFGVVYPPRPRNDPALPIADPAPARLGAHLTIAAEPLRALLEGVVPGQGDGTMTMLTSKRKYRWERGAIEMSFGQGLITLRTKVKARVDLPIFGLDFELDVAASCEPVLTKAYQIRLQAVNVQVTSQDRRLKLAQSLAGILDRIEKQITPRLTGFSYDLTSPITEVYRRISRPIHLPLGEAKGCALLRVLGVEAGPTVLAQGIEKDIAVVVAPEVTLPCAASAEPPGLPPLNNVTTVLPGPFTIDVPIAARYDELAKAMRLTFTDGKYFFSSQYPELYLEDPELYASQGKLVLRLRLRGRARASGIDTALDGDIFFTGHPTVVDNEVQLADLEPTIETKNFFLKLKAALDGDKIRDQARSALRIDLSRRFLAVRERLSSELTFERSRVCVRGFIDRLEVTGVHAHQAYLRVYLTVTGRAELQVLCSPPAPAAAPDAAPDAAPAAAPAAAQP